MDYTTLAKVKAAMDSQETTSDTVLAEYITNASRYLDRLCTSQPDVVDYFKSEAVVDEVLTNGVINYEGRLTVFPHKPVTKSIQAFAYRYSLREAWITADLTLTLPLQTMVIFEGSLSYSESIYVKMSYTGGLGSSVANLPPDFVDLATVMTVRLYKEARSGLGDTIGVAELGTMVYTKAFPARVLNTLNIGNYMRTAPWT